MKSEAGNSSRDCSNARVMLGLDLQSVIPNLIWCMGHQKLKPCDEAAFDATLTSDMDSINPTMCIYRTTLERWARLSFEILPLR